MQASKKFLSTPSARRATQAQDAGTEAAIFLSTPSARRATTVHREGLPFLAHFYPRPLRGGRLNVLSVVFANAEFLSTPSARRATPVLLQDHTTGKFLSTPSARRATGDSGFNASVKEISIHALCEEGDDGVRIMDEYLLNFYPRPLRGGRLLGLEMTSIPKEFLSTPSARRATFVWGCIAAGAKKISIHALCEEGDPLLVIYCFQTIKDFYPRPLRGGRPSQYFLHGFTRPNFYPRPLRGGRLRPDSACRAR